MWGYISAESSWQTNFNTGFSSSRSDILLHLSQWQYWWWFWFSFIWVFYFFVMNKTIRGRVLKMRPKYTTSFRPHGKWGDFLVALIPVSWCINILINSNFILRLIEWQNESSLFTIRIRGRQWYWVYKFELKNFTDILSTPKNIGSNKWQINVFGELQNSEDYLHILQLRSQNKWVKNYWRELLDTTGQPAKTSILTSVESVGNSLVFDETATTYCDKFEIAPIDGFLPSIFSFTNQINPLVLASYELDEQNWWASNSSAADFFCDNTNSENSPAQVFLGYAFDVLPTLLNDLHGKTGVSDRICTPDNNVAPTSVGCQLLGVDDSNGAFDSNNSVFGLDNSDFANFDGTALAEYLHRVFAALTTPDVVERVSEHVILFESEPVGNYDQSINNDTNGNNRLMMHDGLDFGASFTFTDDLEALEDSENTCSSPLIVSQATFNAPTTTSATSVDSGFVAQGMLMTGADLDCGTYSNQMIYLSKLGFFDPSFDWKTYEWGEPLIDYLDADFIVGDDDSLYYKDFFVATSDSFADILTNGVVNTSNVSVLIAEIDGLLDANVSEQANFAGILNDIDDLTSTPAEEQLFVANSEDALILAESENVIVQNLLLLDSRFLLLDDVYGVDTNNPPLHSDLVDYCWTDNFDISNNKDETFREVDMNNGDPLLWGGLHTVAGVMQALKQSAFIPTEIKITPREHQLTLEYLLTNSDEYTKEHDIIMTDSFYTNVINSTSSECVNPDFFDGTRQIRRAEGTLMPMRILKLPVLDTVILENSHIDNTLDLFRVRFNELAEEAQVKNTPHTSYLTFKQKRYKRKKIIPNTTRLYVDETGKKRKTKLLKYNYKPLLVDNNIFTDATFKELHQPQLNQEYRMIKKNKTRSEAFSIITNRRLLRTKKILVIPAHVNLSIISNSYDVVHAWWLPGLGIKIDCVPGRSTHHTFFVDNVGFYYGQCAEICGRYHHHMPIRVCALPYEHFLVWWHSFGLPKLLHTKAKKRLETIYGFRKYSW